MTIFKTEIPDVKVVCPDRWYDSRGFFQQCYHEIEYKNAGIDIEFVQDNWSRSTKGVLRGLHFQRENPQAKLVSVIRGEILDVAVDLRYNSPTYGKWVSEILSDTNGKQLYIPKGFAHGFYTLSEHVDLMYKCSDFYTPGDEYCLKWDDPDVNIKWNLIEVPKVSAKDKNGEFLVDIRST